MEAARIVGGLAFVASFFAAATLFVWIASNAAHHQHGSKAALVSGAGSSKINNLMRNGIGFLVPLANKLLGMKPIARYALNLQNTLAKRDIVVEPAQLTSIVIGSSMVIFACGLLISRSLVFAITAIALCLIGVNYWIAKQQEQLHVHLREELPSAIQAMNTCFCVGYSLPQIFEQVSLDLNGPLKTVFQKTADVINAGSTIEEALDVLKHETNEPELFFLATALEIQHRTGSSLSQVLDVVRESVSDQLELKRLLRTQTAQAKLSAQIVTIMPFLLIGIFSLVSEGFLVPFFTSALGMFLLALAIAMQAAGIVLVRKLLKVEVV